MPALRTIGYQGARLADFIATLRAAGVTTLVDVRAIPWSRRPEFAQAALAEAVAAAGISYVHLRGLGNPAKHAPPAENAPAESYRAAYMRHLDSPAALADLDRAATLARDGNACLMCLERNPRDCHRSLTAETLARITGLPVDHLLVVDPDAPRLL
ncbi:MAG: DUF488 domain-containing protein [Rhodospirillales bacterium]|nr:DUF488 domain-containing protein [Rhodospirillales bacterium]